MDFASYDSRIQELDIYKTKTLIIKGAVDTTVNLCDLPKIKLSPQLDFAGGPQ